MIHADIFWLRDDATLSTEMLVAALTPDEQAGLAALTHATRRRGLALSRRLLREVLAPRLRMPPADIRFARTGSGRLILAHENSWQFSLSHAAGLTAVIVAEAACGVDIEQPREVAADRIARRYFSVREQQYLDSLAPETRAQAFFRLWTLKEAAVKALGQGLARNLDRLAFDVSRNPPALLDTSIPLQLFQHAGAFFLAAAVKCNDEVHWQIREIRSADLLQKDCP